MAIKHLLNISLKQLQGLQFHEKLDIYLVIKMLTQKQ